MLTAWKYARQRERFHEAAHRFEYCKLLAGKGDVSEGLRQAELLTEAWYEAVVPVLPYRET